MAKVLVVCATRTGETLKIGELIAEGIRLSGHEANVMKVNAIKKETDLQGYDGLVFGSATYHGGMIQGMKTMLFLAEKAGLEGKAGGAFGAFGWSGEAPDRIFDTMKNIFKMNMVGGPLRLKASYLGGGVQMAQDYGREIAEKL
ncbi:MAG: flavodoxin domain-containing protein [Desulfobacteraceae bacterium]|jgi:NAD(P)H dehydrogenase (quinone)|nr:flavodoxin domain-containing protein [Desulfobacteraceae bacterium]MDH3573358.1 flavodoxin domain-containing protein [Desulfobacteraceae bacterium]MDH3719933.1 flavodoxin domain-containing protein [Desulfobacteraceae bacterium]MDH3835563.1 flavodoxin domain-containing protein [Desulfobacteraceae bacterium]MDH3873444.1 flavodoxin domain-containing protein [Desulfobacteraceae bacterium]